ncbi:SAV_2336 N-terminal domain-related protein [Streptomyces sp. TLI_146]|uniref:SAV_2336 N-terminal domain-related protein n=1 Tax=Streptomyces sp. TLI_146 TaxID=1938858 RepID=UPI000C705F2F|nr:SAV_2336 N-terminal domain-related protein [Streptomyces sp. TLI_146]PKV88770.1 MinD-like ATPase involved in chromosome partitioning or flagellar assembly [Streptomyces sp. TLI_146]
MPRAEPSDALAKLAALVGHELSTHELLDTLWLAARLPSGAAAPLASALAPDRARQSGPPVWEEPRTPPEGTAVPPDGSGDGDPKEGTGSQPPLPTQLLGALHAAAASRSAPEFTGATASPPRSPRGTGALPVRVPEEKALGDGELRLSRSLRLLKQPHTGSHFWEFDEEATATAMAESGLPDVVLRPARQRWLDLTLLIDDGLSMLLWRRLATELRSVFERLGAFRDIRVHGLDARSADAPGLKVRPFDPGGPLLSPASSADPSGRTLVLVISDGVGACWRDGRMHTALERWARQGPTAVVHALPAHMWDASGIRSEQWSVTTRRRGAANHTWEVTDPLLPPGLGDRFPGVPVPVLEPYPPAVAAWARLVASPGASAELPLLAPPGVRGLRGEAATRGTDPADAVLRFRDAASPQAYRLAAHLAAISPLTVPVMRLVQAAVPWRSDTAHLAEVFLGGLMRQADPPGPGLPAQHRRFGFLDGVQEILLDTASPIDLLRTTRAVTDRLATLVGRSPDFPAWLAHPSGTGELLPGTRPFAWLEDRLLTHLGAKPMISVQPPSAVVEREEVGLPSVLEAAPSWQPLQLLDQQVLGPYTLQLRDESRGKAVAYIGEDQDGRQVLIRVARSPDSPTARELLATERRALRRMDGVYAPVVVASDLNETTPTPWIALGLDPLSNGLPAPTLSAVLQAAGPLRDSPLLAWLGWSLARAVARCHGKGLVHGALTPGTVLVTERTLHIVSWTSVRIDGASSASLLTVPPNSPYRAPEVTSWGESRITAGDVYSVGAILLHAVTGRHWRQYQFDLLRRHPEFRRLDEHLRDLLLRSVDEEPEARPTARELAEAFGALLPVPVEWEEYPDDPAAADTEDDPEEEDDREQWIRTIRAPLRRPLRIAVLGVKDRAGCTTITTVLGAVLAEQRQERVLAVDTDRHAGTHIHIARRVYRATEACLNDLARSGHEVEHFEHLRLFLSQHRSGLMVLANDSVSHPPSVGQFADYEYRKVADVTAPYFDITLADTDKFPQVVLELANRVVIVSRADPAGVTQVQRAVDRLVSMGRSDLVAEAVVVLNHSRPAAGWTLDAATIRSLSSRCRGILTVPRDGHLTTGSTVELSWLAPETYKAFLRLGALLVED